MFIAIIFKKVYEKVLQTEMKVLIHPEKRFWGDTIFRVEDSNGCIWTFATPTHDFEPHLLLLELI